MATYVYRCKPCSYFTEVQHSMLEEPEVTCETCGERCNRVPQAAGVVLKGGGWYKGSGREQSGESL